MLARLLFVLVLALSSVTAVAEDTKGPVLGDLLNFPPYRSAWVNMLAGAVLPQWVEEYAKTLDGPATPSIAVTAGDNIYTLGFTCQPNNCGDNQLYVLFSPNGAKAWGLLLTGKEKTWLGSPDESIRDTFLSGLE